MFLKGCNLWGFARGLPTDDSPEFGGWLMSEIKASATRARIREKVIQGPNVFTTASMFFASTL
jgi:hypothetical protein